MCCYLQFDVVFVVLFDCVYGEDYWMWQMMGVQCDGVVVMLIVCNSMKNWFGGIVIEMYVKWYCGLDIVVVNEVDLIMMEWLYMCCVIDVVVVFELYVFDVYDFVLLYNVDLFGWNVLCCVMCVLVEWLYVDNIYVCGYVCCLDFLINLVDVGFDVVVYGQCVFGVMQLNCGVYVVVMFYLVGCYDV